MNTSAPVITRLCAIGLASLLTASCTTVTGGSALPQRNGASTSMTAAARLAHQQRHLPPRPPPLPRIRFARP